jgi:hypothetical protein
MAFTENAISTKTTTDSLGRQVSQPMNVNGGKSGGFNLDLTKKIWGVDIGFNGMGGFSRSLNFVNGDLAKNDVFNGGGGIQLTEYVEGKFAAQVSTDLSYFKSTSSVNSSASVQYWSQKHHGSFTIYAIPHFEINSTIDYTWQGKSNAFASNTSVIGWNSYIGRNLFQNKVSIRFQFNNMLNQNAGINRTNVNNVSTQTSTNILGRYWMLSAVYHFDRKFKNK